jgi:acyl-CoA synthetase (AMP-forming)/AMP-acid ligase II
LNDGTTPTKGATHTHASLAAQCDSLAAAWEWRDDDLIYHALPLHHIHGIVNAWMCAHYVGARVEFGVTTGKVLKERRSPRERGRMGSSLTA